MDAFIQTSCTFVSTTITVTIEGKGTSLFVMSLFYTFSNKILPVFKRVFESG